MTSKPPAKKAPAKAATLADRKAAEKEAAENPKTNEPEPADPHVPDAEVAERLEADPMGDQLKAWHVAQCNIDKIEETLARDDVQPRVRDELLARLEEHQGEQDDAVRQLRGLR